MLTVYWKYNRYDEGWLEYKREATSLLDPNYSHALQYYMLQCFRSLKPSSGYEYLVPHSIFWLFPTHIQLASELVFGLIKRKKMWIFLHFRLHSLPLFHQPSLAARSLPSAFLVLIVFVLCSSTESRV